ncbi:unnamed protein product [Oppiella nova]|uniref:Uncharacterized protein n=1 Tax=Oppiella nova TaxID=334625 RepID=A0A7R9QSJ9_9ACAR|nr:unnamed protein product [Oppiella nova]CAG2172357.1 unnamed protein product [Oppiella nova]
MSKFVQQIRTYNTFDSKYLVKRYNTWLENNKLFMQMECCSHCLRENSASLNKQDINNIGIIGKSLFESLIEKKQEFSFKLLMRIQKSWKRVLCDVGVNIDTINDLFNRMTSETPANRTTTELMQEFNRISRNSIQIDETMIASSFNSGKYMLGTTVSTEHHSRLHSRHTSTELCQKRSSIATVSGNSDNCSEHIFHYSVSSKMLEFKKL